MRRGLLFGMGLAGALSGSALAQLPSSPRPSTPALPPGYQPLAPATAARPAGGLPLGAAASEPQALPMPPAPEVEIPTAIPADHPWRLKPEHGAYFISVKSYSRPPRPTTDDQGPSALTLAQALAREIREAYQVQAFLFEHISEERKAEAAAIAAARARGREYAAQWNKLREKSQLLGMEFLEPDQKIRYKTVKYRDQIAVLVGPFNSAEDARKALDKVHTWPAPRTKVKDHLGREIVLMDMGTILRPGPNGKQLIQESPVNPFPTATVVPNPAIVRPAVQAGERHLDPFLVKLNEGRPYSLLNATKSWTLGVQSYCAPVEIVGKDAATNVMRKFGSSKGADALIAGAEQAESLAKALRELKINGQPLEAFVFHTRTASLVTVGQFDGPNDPELLRMQKMLSELKMNVTEDRTGLKPVTNGYGLFGKMIPMPIPKR